MVPTPLSNGVLRLGFAQHLRLHLDHVLRAQDLGGLSFKGGPKGPWHAPRVHAGVRLQHPQGVRVRLVARVGHSFPPVDGAREDVFLRQRF